MSNQDLAIVRNAPDHSVTLMPLLPEQAEWKVMSLIADTMALTSFLPTGIGSAPEALAIILIGRELGIPPMTALRQIVMISGKPCIQGQLMIALMQRAGHRVDPVEQSPTRAIVEIQRKGEEKAWKFEFTIKEADQAGLTTKKGSMYDKWATDMLWWRAVARGCRTKGADVLLGLRLPEELGAEVVYNDDGSSNVIMDAPIIKEARNETITPAPKPQPLPKPVAKVKEAKIENDELVVEATKIPEQEPPASTDKPNPFTQFDIEMDPTTFNEWCKKLDATPALIASYFKKKDFKEVIELLKKESGLNKVARLMLYSYIELVKQTKPEFPWTWDAEYQEPLKVVQ